jgi:tRNA U34 2-thiouridine synthase MnmA/TrmU
MSGGLDSSLAVKLMLDQGIEIQGLFLKSPFGCSTKNVVCVAEHLGVPLRMVEKGKDYVELVRNPKYGYGKNMNPCIDCRAFMFILAKRVMEEEGADFLVTGEVLGQRPMSQMRRAMQLIDRESRMEGLVLRPLSAKHFPQTKPELEGWVDREKLLGITGRSRKEQLQRATDHGLKGFGPPAGGCLLTDPNYSARLSEFFAKEKSPSMTAVRLLRYGRHIDLDEKVHLVMGRNEKENGALRQLFEEEERAGKIGLIEPLFSGPSAVLTGAFGPTQIKAAGRILAQYAKQEGECWIEVRYGGDLYTLSLTAEESLTVSAT